MWDYTDASSLFFNNQNIEDFVMSEEPKPDQQIGQIHLNNTMMWDFGFKSQESDDISAIEQKIKGMKSKEVNLKSEIIALVCRPKNHLGADFEIYACGHPTLKTTARPTIIFFHL